MLILEAYFGTLTNLFGWKPSETVVAGSDCRRKPSGGWHEFRRKPSETVGNRRGWQRFSSETVGWLARFSTETVVVGTDSDRPDRQTDRQTDRHTHIHTYIHT